MKHLHYLKIVNYIDGALTILISLVMIGVGLVPYLMVDEPAAREPLLINLITFVVIAVMLFPLGIFVIIMAPKVAEGRWRIAQTVYSVLCIGSVPLGTAYALYALWVCWMNEETKAVFQQNA